MRAMKSSVEELLTKPLAPIYERAAKDFEIPGIRDIEAISAVQTIAMEKLWLSEGRENLLRNVPRLWESGVGALNAAGITSIPSAESVYTNRYVDAVTRS